MLLPEFEVLILLILVSSIVGIISSTEVSGERIWLNALINSEPFMTSMFFT
jgi:hypothetical protein